MEIIRSYWLPISAFLIIVAMTLAASATDRQSSANDFDPDYPVGTPPILGGTGYVTETSTDWHNAQDWSEYNTNYSGYHPGEDWNYGYGTDDVGEPVYAIAAGAVFDTRDALFNDKSGYGSGIAIEHTLPSGEKIYSVYEHIDITSGLNKGDPVWQSDRIGSIADTTKLSPHLHFEIRTKQVDIKDWYPNDNGYGYYASEEKLHADGFTVDPSDFIDSHRSAGESVDARTASQVTLTLYVHDGSADGPTISGAQITGKDASGNNFQQITNGLGFVTLTGDPGTWSLSVSADGYETNSWDQEITEADTKDSYLMKSDIQLASKYSQSNSKFLSNNQASEVLIDDDVERCIYYDSYSLKLEEGYELALISLEDNHARFRLSKNGKILNEKTVDIPVYDASGVIRDSGITDPTYYFKTNIGDVEDIIQIAVHFKHGFYGAGGRPIVTANKVFQISDKPTRL